MAEENKEVSTPVEEITTNWDELTPTFDSMDLKEELLRGIYAYGFERPSAIQQRAIKPTLIGKDVIAQAQSGELIPPTVISIVSSMSHTNMSCPEFFLVLHLPSPSLSFSSLVLQITRLLKGKEREQGGGTGS